MGIDPSAAPVRERGVHSRAGNAMGRTRTAVLDGAARAVEKHGSRKATMADVAALAGVAKGTLYNHFRDKDAVYAAAIDATIRSLTEDAVSAAAHDLAGALADAADRLGSHPALRRIAADEPAVLAGLTTPGDTTVWGLVRSGVRDTLVSGGAVAGSADVDLVLRWLVSAVSAPMIEPAVQAARLAGCLAAGEERSVDLTGSDDATMVRLGSATGYESAERSEVTDQF